LAADARLVVEPSGAVAFAAYLHRADRLGMDGNVVAVVSGGNIALDTFAHILAPTTPPALRG
jgi:threonine dehydratase